MKKRFLPLTIAALVAFSCTTEKPAGTTILGDGTPYSNYQEIMVGKVKTVVEKNYRAIPDGDNFKKEHPLTRADRDSLGSWTDDFVADFDENGVITACDGLDESGNKIWKNESVVEKGKLTRVNIFRKDTLRTYYQYKYGDNGFQTGVNRFRAGTDTLIASFTIKTNSVGYPTEYLASNPKGEPTGKYMVTYDDQNRFIKFASVDTSGRTTYSHEVKLNDQGKVSELIFRDKDNQITASNYFTYEYDAKGNWVKAIVKDDKNHVVIEERTYTYFD